MIVTRSAARSKAVRAYNDAGVLLAYDSDTDIAGTVEDVVLAVIVAAGVVAGGLLLLLVLGTVKVGAILVIPILGKGPPKSFALPASSPFVICLSTAALTVGSLTMISASFSTIAL